MMSTSRSAPEKKTAFRRWREGARWGLAASRIRCTFITASANSIYAGGRETKESVIDPTVGLVFSKKVADPVKKGDVLATIYGNDEEKVKQAVLHFKENYHIIEEKPTKPIMIREVLS